MMNEIERKKWYDTIPLQYINCHELNIEKGPYSTDNNLEISTAYLTSNSISTGHHTQTDPYKWRNKLERSSLIEIVTSTEATICWNMITTKEAIVFRIGSSLLVL